jgi:hypothetical protein
VDYDPEMFRREILPKLRTVKLSGNLRGGGVLEGSLCMR